MLLTLVLNFTTSVVAETGTVQLAVSLAQSARFRTSGTTSVYTTLLPRPQPLLVTHVMTPSPSIPALTGTASAEARTGKEPTAVQLAPFAPFQMNSIRSVSPSLTLAPASQSMANVAAKAFLGLLAAKRALNV